MCTASLPCLEDTNNRHLGDLTLITVLALLLFPEPYVYGLVLMQMYQLELGTLR